MPEPTDGTVETYDVCLSFADEQRAYVAETATLLEEAGLRVFYDAFETAQLWGRDLYEHLDEIYSRRSRFCVLFISADYSRKAWTNHERAAAQERALHSRNAYVLPVRFDDTRIPGIRSTTGYIDANRTSPAELVTLLLSKLGREKRPASVAATVLTLTAENPPVDCETSLRAVLGARRTGTTYESCADGAAIAVVPIAVMTPFDVLTSCVPALERAVAWPGVRARIVLHRGEIPLGHGPASLDVTATVSAARAMNRAPHAGCLIAISDRAHAELVRSGEVPAGAFRKADVPGEATPWDLYVRADARPGAEPGPDEAPPRAHTRVGNTVHHVTADNVVFGVQVTNR
jgi:hypothetical protein